MRMVLAVSALGLPAVVLPVGIAGGLPQAVQLIGPRYREDLCLDAAAAIEDRLGILTPIDPRIALRARRLPRSRQDLRPFPTRVGAEHPVSISVCVRR